MDGPPPAPNAAAIQPLLTLILIITPLGSVLVPLIITLFFFSTPQLRRRPVFILNILACCSGICEAIIIIAVVTTAILCPPALPRSKPSFMAATILASISSLFIDSILIFRILAFYSPSVTPTNQLVTIFALPILVKCGRFFGTVMYMYDLAHIKPTTVLTAQPKFLKNSYLFAVLCLQAIDNIYASAILLYKLHQFARESNQIPAFRSQSLLDCLHCLFITALGNFIFPVVINITSVILTATTSPSLDISYLMMSNTYISIFGVVFATIWTRRGHWNRDNVAVETSGFQLEVINCIQTAMSTFQVSRENERDIALEERIGVQKTSTREKQGNIDSQPVR